MNPKILALAISTAVLCGACTQQNPVPLVKSSEEDRTEATGSYSRKPEQREATPRQTLQADRSFASGKIQLGKPTSWLIFVQAQNSLTESVTANSMTTWLNGLVRHRSVPSASTSTLARTRTSDDS